MSNPNPKNQFKKGEVNNPNGRPKKGYSITEMMKELLENKRKDKKTGKMMEVRRMLGHSIIAKALQGDTAAQKMVWQYMDGMPQQSTDITSKGEQILVMPSELIEKYDIDTKPKKL